MSTIEDRVKRHREALAVLTETLRAAEALDEWFTRDRARESEVSRGLIEQGLLEIFRGRAAFAAKQIGALHEMIDDLVEPGVD
jgi:hypothetical protein